MGMHIKILSFAASLLTPRFTSGGLATKACWVRYLASYRYKWVLLLLTLPERAY